MKEEMSILYERLAYIVNIWWWIRAWESLYVTQ